MACQHCCPHKTIQLNSAGNPECQECHKMWIAPVMASGLLQQLGSYQGTTVPYRPYYGDSLGNLGKAVC